ncbi:hypothetical protein OK074_4954 [Actinobacteria bacterium OK074]|nr:hypothetical protein OK074_4954 [Actinobacteria bacterium OK074]
MADAISYLIIGLLLFQALWRIPAALRGHSRERSLWGAFAALAGSWMLRNGAVREAADDLGVTDLSYLLKHCVAIIGICVLLRYVSTIYRSVPAAPATPGTPETPGTPAETAPLPRSVRVAEAVHRIATKASVATILVMAGVFVFALHDPDTSTFYLVARYAGQPGLPVYLGLFYLYVGGAAAVCGYQWGNAWLRARRTVRAGAKRWTLLTGLMMMSVAMGLAVIYAVIRTAFTFLVTFEPVSAHVNQVQENVTDTLLYATFLLFTLGSIAPATQAGISRWRTVLTLNEIYPLWHEMATAIPEVVLRRPSDLLPGRRFSRRLNRLRDLLRLDPPPYLRLERYVTEISDANRTLSHYAPEGLYARAVALAERERGAGAEARALADAYWMTGALHARQTGTPAHRAPADSLPGLEDDFDSYLPRLLRATATYRTLRRDAALALLRPATTA